MSAFQVHDDTIDLLVSAADAWRVQFDDENGERKHACTYRDEAGQLLSAENHRSVTARYGEMSDPPPTYRHKHVDLNRASCGMPIAVLVLGSVRCLRYQSCETPDYDSTRAAMFLGRIEAEACRKLIGTYDAPWGFTRDWMESKRGELSSMIKASLAATERPWKEHKERAEALERAAFYAGWQLQIAQQTEDGDSMSPDEAWTEYRRKDTTHVEA